jgi:reverse transcriptase-like protein
LISAAPYRDRIVHHALCNPLEPIYERTFIHDSYACRPGKGTHAAVNRYQVFARSNVYVLKCDVRKFFPSVDHQILESILRRKIKDPGVIWLMSLLLRHSNEQELVSGFFPGDDLFTQGDRRRGIPIGNQTSQFFANVLLNPLDHFIKEELGCHYYVRYADDFVVLDNDKRRLAEIRDGVEAFLCDRRLWLHPQKRVISRVCDGIRFLGFRVWPNHRWLAKPNVLLFRRRLTWMQREVRAGRMPMAAVTRRIRAWLGHPSQADTRRLRKRLLRCTFVRGKATEFSCSPGRLVQQQPAESAVGESQREHPRQP